MELLIARDLSVAREGRPLLAGVGWTLRAGERVGLVGPNGSGKSTLLAVLAGRRPPEGGTLRRAPGARVVLLPQRDELPDGATVREAARGALAWVRELEARLRAAEARLGRGEEGLDDVAAWTERFERAGGYEAEARLGRELAAIFPAARLEARVGELSGGERRRLALATAFAQGADVLLLDEPSNGLDWAARAWLAERLRRHPGAAVVASHDRALLDAATTHTAVLEGGRLELERGAYGAVRERRDARLRSARKRARERAKEEARVRATQAQLRAWGAAAQRQRRGLERRLPAVPDLAPGPDRPQAGLELASAGRRGLLLAAAGLRAAPALERADPRIEAGDKIALLGPNGSGKSSLLALLARVRESDDPRTEWHERDGLKVAYLDQATRGLEAAPLLAQLERWVSAPRARQLLALARIPTERWAGPPAALSGGERARAAVALLIAREAELLLLDEPESDLDLPMIEALEEALAAGEAAVVLATHDRRLAERVADRVWTIEDGRLVEYRGGVEGWLGGRRRREPDLPLPGPEADGAGAAPAASAEARLEGLEREALEVEERLADPLVLGDRDRARLEARRRQLTGELAAAYEARWAARTPAPRPRLRVVEGPLRLEADPDGDALRVETDLPVRVGLRRVGPVVHLALVEEDGACLLPWAHRRLAEAAARLALLAFHPEAVQVQSARDLTGTVFEPAGEDWWLAPRARLLAREGWVPPREAPRSRRRRRRARPRDDA